MSKKNDVPLGEYIFWMVVAFVVGMAVIGLITQTAVRLILDIHITIFQAIGIDLVVSLLGWLVRKVLGKK